ncbi:MAG TPA: peptidylprolyl isomerase [Bacteroidales bacterium]|nr:peptidylprolyl isomerase [Bacteroidales bacterium]
MIKRNLRFCLVLIGLFLPVFVASSQELIESVAAIVGNEVIYLSDIEVQAADQRRNGDRTPVDKLRCRILEGSLISKLFLDQARIDSIVVANDAVDSELDMRMNDAIRRAGSEQALVDYFRKSMVEIRRDIKKTMIEQRTVSEVQSKIAGDIKVTPAGLKRFFSSIPKDSLPVIPAKYKISIIQLDPPSSEENKAEARQKLLDIRSQILGGKSFYALATLYSEDTETAKRGGELGFVTRGEVEKEYADAAFSLSKNGISKIVETRYGFHLIQLIDKKGEMVNTRHILIKPQVKPSQANEAINRLDSLANMIRKDSIKFETAAIRFSTHKDSRINGGKLVSSNPNERISWFSLEELNKDMYVKRRDKQIGEISDPFQTTDENNNVVFRIIRLDEEVPAHTANLTDDYQVIYNAAIMNEQTKTYDKWVKQKIESTYIKISDEYKSCEFLKDKWLK